jgi:hypothetical protein
MGLLLSDDLGLGIGGCDGGGASGDRSSRDGTKNKELRTKNNLRSE